MSGVAPRASYSQGPESWSPCNPSDSALVKHFSHGVFSAHRSEGASFAPVVAFLGGYIASTVRDLANIGRR